MYYYYKGIKMIKVRELVGIGEILFRSVNKYPWNYGEDYTNITINVHKSVIKKELPIFIDKKD